MIYNNPIGPRIFTCSMCGKVYKAGNRNCLVVHLGKGCCHYGDTEIKDIDDPSERNGTSLPDQY